MTHPFSRTTDIPSEWIPAHSIGAGVRGERRRAARSVSKCPLLSHQKKNTCVGGLRVVPNLSRNVPDKKKLAARPPGRDGCPRSQNRYFTSMRAVVQRVSRASVTVGGEVVGRIERGLLVLLGVAPDDTPEHVRWLADKIVGLRIFRDDEGKMNRDVVEVGGGVLVVSQFTLYGDCSKGKRPSFIGAARPEVAIPLYETFINAVKALGVPVAAGQFGADMSVELVNEGPVTLIVEKS